MRTLPQTARMLFLSNALAISISGCASTGHDIADLSGLPPVPLRPFKDNIIMPGYRVGSVSLGMMAPLLHRVRGDPKSSERPSEVSTVYNFGDVTTTMLEATRKVHQITVTDQKFRTKEGLGVGASKLAVLAKYGSPAPISPEIASIETLCYPQGIVFALDDGVVSKIIVRPPGC